MSNGNELIITKTWGELGELIESIVDKRVSEAMAGLSAPKDDEYLHGGDEIAHALGINRNTFYKLLNEGRLGTSVKHVGRKLIANKRELMTAISDGGWKL